MNASIATSNMVLFDSEGKIKKYNTAEELLREFYDIRLETYVKRKEFMANKLTEENDRLTNKVRFITAVIQDELNIRNVAKAKILTTLRKQGYTAYPKKKVAQVAGNVDADDSIDESEVVEGAEAAAVTQSSSDYDYLLSMPLWSLTMEKVNKMKQEQKDKQAELDELLGTTTKQMWTQDLDKLEVAIDEHEAAEQKDIKGGSKAKAKAKKAAAWSDDDDDWQNSGKKKPSKKKFTVTPSKMMDKGTPFMPERSSPPKEKMKRAKKSPTKDESRILKEKKSGTTAKDPEAKALFAKAEKKTKKKADLDLRDLSDGMSSDDDVEVFSDDDAYGHMDKVSPVQPRPVGRARTTVAYVDNSGSDKEEEAESDDDDSSDTDNSEEEDSPPMKKKVAPKSKAEVKKEVVKKEVVKKEVVKTEVVKKEPVKKAVVKKEVKIPVPKDSDDDSDDEMGMGGSLADRLDNRAARESPFKKKSKDSDEEDDEADLDDSYAFHDDSEDSDFAPSGKKKKPVAKKEKAPIVKKEKPVVKKDKAPAVKKEKAPSKEKKASPSKASTKRAAGQTTLSFAEKPAKKPKADDWAKAIPKKAPEQKEAKDKAKKKVKVPAAKAAPKKKVASDSDEDHKEESDDAYSPAAKKTPRPGRVRANPVSYAVDLSSGDESGADSD
jgi:DNA topoisomerase-2